MGKISEIRKFASLACGERVTIARMRSDWAMGILSKEPRLILPYDLNQNDKGDKLFRADFIRRCPLARGFANVTISILHEIGHWITQWDVDWEKYWEEAEYMTGELHFLIEAEWIATNWAIAWLQNPEHRKQAKAFERRFFSCGK